MPATLPSGASAIWPETAGANNTITPAKKTIEERTVFFMNSIGIDGAECVGIQIGAANGQDCAGVTKVFCLNNSGFRGIRKTTPVTQPLPDLTPPVFLLAVQWHLRCDWIFSDLPLEKSQRRFSAGVDFELFITAFQMVVHGPDANLQCLGNLFIDVTLADIAQDLLFTIGQLQKAKAFFGG